MLTIQDRVLVWQFNRGDVAGMCRIYEQYRGYLMRVAAALLNDRAHVEDVVHDVFVGFAQTTGRFELRGSLKAYLSICVANRARDVNRSTRRCEALWNGNADSPSAPMGPEAETMRHELAARINDAMARLPDEQREIVVLHLLGELPFRQIAALKEISINTAMSRYRYGLEKLRSAVDGSNSHA